MLILFELLPVLVVHTCGYMYFRNCSRPSFQSCFFFVFVLFCSVDLFGLCRGSARWTSFWSCRVGVERERRWKHTRNRNVQHLRVHCLLSNRHKCREKWGRKRAKNGRIPYEIVCCMLIDCRLDPVRVIVIIFSSSRRERRAQTYYYYFCVKANKSRAFGFNNGRLAAQRVHRVDLTRTSDFCLRPVRNSLRSIY